MSRRLAATMGLLSALVLGGCAGTDAVAGDGSSSSPKATKLATESAHAGHHHHHDYSDVVVEVSLEPYCVEPGGTLTVAADTAPRTGVLYLAYFSDGKSGAREPLGAGYGGNGGGYADEDGQFEESWTVSDDAPLGPGRLRVLTVADDGEEYIDFTVADPGEGNC